MFELLLIVILLVHCLRPVHPDPAALQGLQCSQLCPSSRMSRRMVDQESAMNESSAPGREERPQAALQPWKGPSVNCLCEDGYKRWSAALRPFGFAPTSSYR